MDPQNGPVNLPKLIQNRAQNETQNCSKIGLEHPSQLPAYLSKMKRARGIDAHLGTCLDSLHDDCNRSSTDLKHNRKITYKGSHHLTNETSVTVDNKNYPRDKMEKVVSNEPSCRLTDDKLSIDLRSTQIYRLPFAPTQSQTRSR